MFTTKIKQEVQVLEFPFAVGSLFALSPGLWKGDLWSLVEIDLKSGDVFSYLNVADMGNYSIRKFFLVQIVDDLSLHSPFTETKFEKQMGKPKYLKLTTT